MDTIRQLLKNEPKVVVLDIETTGFSRDRDEIIQMGIVEYAHGVVSRTAVSYFGGKKKVHPSAFECNGITPEMREGKPTFRSMARQIGKYLEDCVLVTHNGNAFDIPFIKAQLKLEGVDFENPRVVDTLKLALKLRGKGGNKLGQLCEDYNITYGAHDALGDTLSTIEVLYKLCEDLELKTLEDVFIFSALKKDQKMVKRVFDIHED
jgi:DNA polymerase III epsilon subunit family exonuclease